jgi:hypothetical protein
MINQQGNTTCAHNAYRPSTPDILLIFQDLSNATDQQGKFQVLQRASYLGFTIASTSELH